MPALEYTSLSKPQKLAAFLVILGPEMAPEVMKQLPDADIENVAREMATMDVIDFDLAEKITGEFCGLIGDGLSARLGGVAFTQRMLEKAKGPQVASNILQKAMPPSSSTEAVRELGQMETRLIFNLIKTEQPQTIAFILSYLETSKMAELLTFFPLPVREDIVERLGSMEAISSEMVGKVLQNLSKHSDGPKARTLHRRGGVMAAAQVLNAMDKGVSKVLITKIEERNAVLGLAIRKKMFSFEDLVRLAPKDIQRIMRDVEMSDVALALKGSKENVRATIFGSMSKRAAEGIKDELQALGSVRAKEVEAAQDRIIVVVRTLEESGEITTDQEGAGDAAA
jgi:flagellar motor switch protein FliG